MQYDLLNGDGKLAALRKRLAQYESVHYDATVSLDLLITCEAPANQVAEERFKVISGEKVIIRTRELIADLEAEMAREAGVVSDAAKSDDAPGIVEVDDVGEVRLAGNDPIEEVLETDVLAAT